MLWLCLYFIEKTVVFFFFIVVVYSSICYTVNTYWHFSMVVWDWWSLACLMMCLSLDSLIQFSCVQYCMHPRELQKSGTSDMLRNVGKYLISAIPRDLLILWDHYHFPSMDDNHKNLPHENGKSQKGLQSNKELESKPICN